MVFNYLINFEAPENSIQVMISVASMFQKRLGGYLQFDGEEFEENRLKQEVKKILQKMASCNIKPGCFVAKELF